MQKNITVIIGSYTSTERLEKVIWGYNTQTYRNFEIIIVDTLNLKKTLDTIQEIKEQVFFPIAIIFEDSQNSEKANLLKNAIYNSSTNYVLITSGDCIPRQDFIEQHIKYREEGYFLSGSFQKFSAELSNKITKENIYSGDCFESTWLKKNGFKTNTRLNSYGIMNSILNCITVVKPKWNEYNASGWKSDVLSVYGAMVENLIQDFDINRNDQFATIGIKSKQILHSAVCIQLND